MLDCSFSFLRSHSLSGGRTEWHSWRILVIPPATKAIIVVVIIWYWLVSRYRHVGGSSVRVAMSLLALNFLVSWRSSADLVSVRLLTLAWCAEGGSVVEMFGSSRMMVRAGAVLAFRKGSVYGWWKAETMRWSSCRRCPVLLLLLLLSWCRKYCCGGAGGACTGEARQ